MADLPPFGSTASGKGLDGHTYTGTVIAVAELLGVVVVDAGWRNAAIVPFTTGRTA